MQQTKIQEAAGIPKNIQHLSFEIFEYIRYELKNRKRMVFPAEVTLTLSKFGDFKLGEKEVGGKLPKIKIHYGQGILKGEETLVLLGMSYRHPSGVDMEKKRLYRQSGEEVLHINFGGTEEEIGFDDLLEFIEKNSENFISSIAHELTHLYVNYKTDSSDSRIEYQYDATTQLLTQGAPIFRDFFFALYLTSPTELHVRNAEIFTAATHRGVTKEDFREFLKENERYQQIKGLVNFSVEKSLFQPIRNYLEKERQADGIKISAEEKEEHFQQVLENLFLKLTMAHMDRAVDTHKMSWAVQLMGPDKELQDFVKHNTKGMRNVDQWLKTSEKQIRQGAEKTIRRIHKVYSELPSREEIGKLQENIIDLDLFCQFYKKPKKGERVYY